MKLPRLTLSLVAGALALGVWLVLGFVIPVGAGWPHLFLALGVTLLVRRLVAGDERW